MVGKKFTLTLSFLLITSTVFGMGVVTDPGSYGYLAEQITSAGKQLEKTTTLINKAKEQIDNLKAVQQKVDGVGDQLKGHYDRAKGFVADVKGIREKLEDSPTTLQGQYAKWKDLKFVDPKKALDDFFKDPRSDNSDVFEALDRKYEVRQTALKNSIVEAENLLQAAPDRLKLIEKLAKQIDETKNTKDAADLTNRLLVEMWRTTEEIKMLLAHTSEAQGLLNFSGVSKEVTTKRKEAVTANNEKRKKGPMDDMLRSQGFDPNNLSNDSLYKAIGF